MNREELKFRAYDGKKMVDDVIPASETSIIELFDRYEWQETEVEAVEQYTGLKDKNGKEIFEGDIVTLNGEWEEIEDTDCSVITFENGCFRVGDGCENEAGSYLSDWRVIGNVHQNADLLEKK